jgi:PIN domain nuclease of toxin-antitoxin system
VSAFLLDTHALIWTFEPSPALSQGAAATILNPNNTIWVSAASIYEIGLKVTRGALPGLPMSPRASSLTLGFSLLDINAEHAERAAALPLIHRDPWDRIIAAQALVEGLIVITRDPAIAALGARVMW